MNKAQPLQFDFRGKTVWVTGAASGIGESIARQFVALGANVIGFDRAFQPYNDRPFTSVTLDISEPNRVAAVCRQQLAETGLDVLVNAAGILRLGDIDTLSADDWHQCINVNASGVFYLLNALVPHFKQQRRGAIVCVGSNAAHVPVYRWRRTAPRKRRLPVCLTVLDWSWRLTVCAAIWYRLVRRIRRCSAACGTALMPSSALSRAFLTSTSWEFRWVRLLSRMRSAIPWFSGFRSGQPHHHAGRSGGRRGNADGLICEESDKS